MEQQLKDPLGAAWLSATYGISLMARLPVLSQIGGRRTTHWDGSFRKEIYPEAMRPTSDLVGHLQFHLRHEIPNLEFLARLFAVTGGDEIQGWINSEPTGQYARRAAFLFEWITGRVLAVPQKLGGNYTDVIDDALVVAASQSKVQKVQRWRVNNNLPGTPLFCPLVLKTGPVNQAVQLDVAELFGQLTNEFGEDLLLRAATWMTLRESKASFAIEGEASQLTRIQRFADVMAKRTGQDSPPLTHDSLADLQREILGPRTTLAKMGLRQSPVFVGETVRQQEIVHYVAPPAEELEGMLEGLRVFLDRTEGQSPVMRSSVAAFGFVYIHPLADGNGRVHRFLVNDILRRDGVIPAPVILPISAVITDDAGERREYTRVLDLVSKPLMQGTRDHVSFSSTRTTYPDGVASNLEFTGRNLAHPIWRYPDLSPHVVFMSNVISRTITEQMHEESKYLRSHHRAREAVKEIVEMPDHQADRLLRSMEQGHGVLSNVLAKEMPVLTEPGVWQNIKDAVAEVYRAEDQIDSNVIERYSPSRPAGKN